MSDLLLDSDGDLLVEASDLQLTSGVDAILQHLLQRLRTFYGEWFLDNRIGIPWFQQILKKNPDPGIVSSVIKNTIKQTPGVVELLSFQLDFDSSNRILTLDFKARTSEGVLDFSEVVP